MGNKKSSRWTVVLWTAEYDKILQELWNCGMDVKDIRRRLGLKFTRSSIHGRVNRLRKKGKILQSRAHKWKARGASFGTTSKICIVSGPIRASDIMEDQDNLCMTEAERIGLAGNSLGLFSGDFGKASRED